MVSNEFFTSWLVWPSRSAVGQQLVVDYSTAGTYPYEVVGVVSTVGSNDPPGATETVP